jgi:REP element-mobilizing transposase RayT
MARQVRIQFEGAVYHVMARGDRRESIIGGDKDRRMFIETVSEACEKTGWLVDAWVLMSNHYHLVLRTPQANLVAGMRWLQNTYTRRFNVRNQLLPGSDPRKVAIAGSIHQSTTTPQGWTAERLQMKSAANVSQQLSRANKAAKPKIKPAKPAI